MSDAILDAIFGPEEQILEKPKFEVKDLQSADWCVFKAIQAEHRIQERAVLVKEYKKKLDSYLLEANKQDETTIAIMQQHLEGWAEEHLKDQKRKSVKLPSGIAGFRQGQESVNIENEVEALAWCRDNLPAAVKITESIRKTEIKKHVEDGGAMPDGVKLKLGERRFYIKEEE